MSRYIDVDIAKNSILNDMALAEREGKDLIGYTDALFHLKTIPIADVEEVKHERWIGRKGRDYYTCSNCCTVTKSKDDEYCRGCGAKMDGKRSENER